MSLSLSLKCFAMFEYLEDYCYIRGILELELKFGHVSIILDMVATCIYVVFVVNQCTLENHVTSLFSMPVVYR